MSKKRIPIALLAAVCLAACSNAPDEKAASGDRLVIGDDADPQPTSLYQMPTPNELFSIVKTMAGEGQKRMMSVSTNAGRYVTAEKRAVNFGIYATDMVYASQYKLNDDVVRYYLAVSKLASGLGLSNAFNDNGFVRLRSNLARGGDSLDVLSDEAYHKAYEKMQEENMGAILTLVLAGGWVESMHLVTHQIHEFDANDPLVARMAEQKTTLEHLIDMMEPYASDVNVAPVRGSLISIRTIFDQLDVTRSPAPAKSSSGRMVIGDDVNVTMTKEKFVEIDKAVEMLRDELTRPEDEAGNQQNS